MSKPFTAEQLSALVIATQLKLPSCPMCGKFATHSHSHNSMDYACKEHILGYLQRFYSQKVEEKDITRLGCADLSDRLNATIWDVDDPDRQLGEARMRVRVEPDTQSTCSLYGCEKDSKVRIHTASGSSFALCADDEPQWV